MTFQDYCDWTGENYEKWEIREQFINQSEVMFSKTLKIIYTAAAVMMMNELNEPAFIMFNDVIGPWYLLFTWSNKLKMPILLRMTREKPTAKVRDVEIGV